MKKTVFVLWIALNSLNSQGQTSTLCLDLQEAEAINLFTADCLAKNKIIDSLEVTLDFYKEVQSLCHQSFVQYEQKLEVKDLMLANQKEQLQAKDAQNKAMADKVKEIRKKKNKQITGLTIGGTGIGVLAGILIGIFAVK